MITSHRNPQSPVHVMNKSAAKELNDKWTPFKYMDNASGCAPSAIYLEQQAGGRPKLSKPPQQLPFDINAQDIFRHMYMDAPAMDTSNYILLNRTEAQLQNDTCQICKCIFPLRVMYLPKCQHMFRSPYLSVLFKVKLTAAVPCPSCRTETPYQQISRPNLQIMKRIRDLIITRNLCQDSGSL